jgi:hypothetical protein
VISRRQREIEIALQPNRLSEWALLQVIESALEEALPLGRRTKTNFEFRPALIRATLILAPIADYVFPPPVFQKRWPRDRVPVGWRYPQTRQQSADAY